MATTDRPADDHGILLPVGDDGTRSSTSFATEVLAEALGTASTADAEAVRAESNWRKQYPAHFVKLVEYSVADPEKAGSIARRGLDALHQGLEFSQGGEIRPLNEAMSEPIGPAFEAQTIEGRSSEEPELAVPYRDEILRDDQLRQRVAEWVRTDKASASFGTAIDELLDHPEWLDLSDQTIVLLGAGAELGPIEPLSDWRANIVAVDLPGADRWQRLQAVAESGNGRMIAPARGNELGADLTTDTPEIAAFLSEFDGPLVLGGYAYADGRAHLRVSAAMDAIESTVSGNRGRRQPTTLAHLLTPSDTYAVTESIAARARERWDQRSLPLRMTQAPLRAMTGGRAFRPHLTETYSGKDGFRAGIVDSLVIQQGPNYALAKRIQQWRSIVARAEGIRVSAPIAPSTRTYSVTKNRALDLAYRGADAFDIEVFEPETANVLMAAMLVRNMRTLTGPADPAVPLSNPLELFQDGAFHGGLWTSPYQTRTGLPFAALAGLNPF